MPHEIKNTKHYQKIKKQKKAKKLHFSYTAFKLEFLGILKFILGNSKFTEFQIHGIPNSRNFKFTEF